MSRHRKKDGIPDRWLDYKAVGKRLHGTRFIAFKVPLNQSLTRQLPRSDVFGPWELLDTVRREKQELGLIIDLTFTTRYYKLQDLPESLLFVKIFTAGHEVPTDGTILSFKRAVHRFLRDNADNDKLIGVHCTHGLNRTGYLICRYLIDVDGMDPKEAVELFSSARGHVMERQNYLDDLQCGPKRSNDGMEESEQEPRRGLAVRRPCFTPQDSDGREDRRPHVNDPWYHRSFPPRGTNHRSHHHHPHDGFPHEPPPLPSPPLYSPMGAPFHPYRWSPPHPDGPWRRPPHLEQTRSRHTPPEPMWGPALGLQEDRRRGPPPPPFHRYPTRWDDESSGYRADEEWGGPRTRHHPHRHTDAHRANGYDRYW